MNIENDRAAGRGVSVIPVRGRLAYLIKNGLPYLPYLVLFIAMIFVNNQVVMYGGDDLITRDLIRKYTLPEFLSKFYFTWSGRFSILTAQYLLIGQDNVLWRYINSLVIALFAYTIARLVLGKKMHSMEGKRLLSYNIIFCLGFGYFYFNVLSASIFWTTGAVCYLWATTAGLWAMTSYRDAISNEYRSKPVQTVILFLSVLFACWGQEQIALIMLCFSVITVVYLLYKNKKVDAILVVETALIIAVTAVCLTAPGTKVRFYQEIATSNPDFLKTPFWDRIGGGLMWVFHTIINDCKLLLILLWSFMGFRLYEKYKRTKKAWLTAIPVVGILFLSLSFVSLKNIPILFTRYDIDKVLNDTFMFFNMSWFPVAFWLFFLGMTLVFIVLIFGKNVKSLYLILILIAAFCSTAIMIFSPSRYPTAHRSLFDTSALFLLVIGAFIQEPEKYPGLIALASIIPILQMIAFLVNWQTGFYVWY